MEFVNDALQLTGTLVEVWPGWVKLTAPVPEEESEPSPISVPTPVDSIASDDSRLGQDQIPLEPSCILRHPSKVMLPPAVPLPPMSPLCGLLSLLRPQRKNCMRNGFAVFLGRMPVEWHN